MTKRSVFGQPLIKIQQNSQQYLIFQPSQVKTYITIRTGKMKNKSGYTIVEVIVTGVIVAILATMAVLVYSGYVTEAQKSSARSICELIGAGIIHTHNRGINITASTATGWDDIGISNPSDQWNYSFGALLGNDNLTTTYDIIADNTDIGKWKFFPSETGAAKWVWE